MHMLSFIFAIVLLLLAIITVVLRKTYDVIPNHELKRQAAAGNQLARQLYRAAAYGLSLRILLWLLLAVTTAGGLVLLINVAPAWLSFVAVILLLWLAFSWLPNTRVTGLGVRLTTLLTPFIARLLHVLDPILQRLGAPFQRRYMSAGSGLYELQDLLDLLDLQASQPDSRITTEELDLMRQVLRFGEYKVRDVLRPRTLIKSVATSDAIGPILLDELHASGQTAFPVKKTPRSKEIVGSLHIGDIGIHSTGTVAEYMTAGATYIHESDSLADALHVFYQTKRQLFIVINSFEEYVGVLTLEDILHELVGRPDPDENLGSHDDAGAVAARHPRKKPLQPDVEVSMDDEKPAEPVSETDETVVE